MKNARMQIVKFDKSDVIATSSVSVTWTGLYDGTVGNATLTYKGIGYLGTTGKTLADLNTAFTGTGASIDDETGFEYAPDNFIEFLGLVLTTGDSFAGDGSTNNPTEAANLNGTYTWNGIWFSKNTN